MKQFIILLLFLFTINSLYSQSISYYSDKIEVKKFYKNNNILIQNDTVYLMNSKTFQIYHSIYLNYKTGSNKDLYETMFALQQLYEKRIEEQNNEFDSLKICYDNLSLESKELIKTNTEYINKINFSLDTLQNNTNKISEQLKELKPTNDKLLTRIMIGSGGIIVGVIIGLII